MVGGNIEVYAEVCETARQEAYGRMVKHALEMGADGHRPDLAWNYPAPFPGLDTVAGRIAFLDEAVSSFTLLGCDVRTM